MAMLAAQLHEEEVGSTPPEAALPMLKPAVYLLVKLAAVDKYSIT